MRRIPLPWLGRQHRLFYREQVARDGLRKVPGVLQSPADARFNNIQVSLISSGLDSLLQQSRSELTFNQRKQKDGPHRIDSPRDLQVGTTEDCISYSIHQDARQPLECCFSATQEYFHTGLQSFTRRILPDAPCRIEVLSGNATEAPDNCSGIEYPAVLEEGRQEEDFHRSLALKSFHQGASYDLVASERLWKRTDKGDTLSLKCTPRRDENYQNAEFYGDKIICEANTGGIATTLKYHGKNCSNIEYPDVLEHVEGRQDEDFHRSLALKSFQQGASYDPVISEWSWKRTDKGDALPLKSTPRNGEKEFYGDNIISEVNTDVISTTLQYGKGLLSGFKHVLQPRLYVRRNCKSFSALVLSRNLHSTSRLEISQARPMMAVQPFIMDLGNANDLSARVAAASSKKLSELYVADLMKEFDRDVRPHLVASCLMLPNQLRHKSTEFLHTQNHKLLKRVPKYVGCRDVMLAKKGLSERDWQRLREQLVSQRVYVVENWQSSFCNIEKLYCDYGIKGPTDGENIYKGECDASFDRKSKATLAFVIWKDDTVIFAQIIRDFVCKSAQVAEACAALFLLWKAKELREIKNLTLITDSWPTYAVLSGSLTLKQNDENFGLYMLLRGMHESFDRLSAQWKTRELVFLPHELASSQYRDPGPLHVETVLRKFSYQLSGLPIFKCSPSTKAKEILTKFEMKPYNERIESRFYVVAEQEAKIDALLQITKTLKPNRIYAAIHNVHHKPIGFQKRITHIFNSDIDGVLMNAQVGEFYIPYMAPVTEPVIDDLGPKGCRHVIFVFDLSVPEAQYSHLDAFTVFLIAPNERIWMRSRGIKELNALSYIYYHGVIEDKIKNVSVEGAEEGICIEADDVIEVSLLHPKYWWDPDLAYPTREDILNTKN